jgi:RNA polymerase sigma factor (sigma-70 family)
MKSVSFHQFSIGSQDATRDSATGTALPADADASMQRTRASLLEKLKRRSPLAEWNSAWTDFFHTYSPLVLAWCQRMGLSQVDAEEVCASVMYRLSKRMERFDYDPSKSFRAWLLRVVEREMWKHQRYRQRMVTGLSDSAFCSSQLHGSGLYHSDIATLIGEVDQRREVLNAAMNAARARVNEKTWAAFMMTAVEGLAPLDVADALAITLVSVYKAKSRVLGYLRTYAKEFSQHDFNR